MRKVFSLCVLMMTLLLSGCAGGGEDQKALDLALTIRSEYLALNRFFAQTELTADYGQRVYEYGIQVDASPEETVLTVTSPDLVAGVTGRFQTEEAFLAYDGLVLETGPLTDDGLTPITAIPALLEAVKSGYITACSAGEDLFRVDCGSPDVPVGTGTEFVLWFDPESHDLVRGEVSQDGRRCIFCEFSQVTKE